MIRNSSGIMPKADEIFRARPRTKGKKRRGGVRRRSPADPQYGRSTNARECIIG